MLFARDALRAPVRRTAALVAALVAASTISIAVFPSAAQAAAAITLAKSAPSSVLADSTATYTLTAANPSSNLTAVPEYNVSFSDVLPAGVSYVAGSTLPASAGEPRVVPDIATGTTRLLWSNVTDLQVGDSFALTFTADTNPVTLPVGSTFVNTATVYANTDPRRVPTFGATGVVTPGSYTESAAATGSPTAVSALRIDKAEPSPEGELLRGVHDNVTRYTLTVSNTGVSATNAVVVTDYLPAALEYLGCGGVDNSAAREYVGAPSLAATPAVPGCVNPASVTTVTNPPAQGGTTYPAGVYTRLQWNLGTMAAGATVTLPYAAGIPLRRNTATFPGGTPTGAGLGQTANLDNNTGASTREGATESGITNVARAEGTYTGPTVGGSAASAADTRESVSIEDVRMRKAASTATFVTLGRVQYTITIDSSEYVSGSAITLTDVIPNGLCPLGDTGTNYVAGAPLDCAGGAGTAPSSPFASVTQNGDGTFTVVFAPLAVTTTPASRTTSVTYWAGMRSIYTGGGTSGQPTSTGDSFTNTASLTATTTPRAGTGETGTQTVTDTSSSTIGTGSLTLDKTIGPRSFAGDCGTTGVGYGEPGSFAPAETRFRKGDLVCFKLRVAFDATTRTRNPVVTDFLPVGTEYVTGSAVATSNNLRAPATLVESPDGLTWTVGDLIGAHRYADLGAVFEWVFAVRVTDAAPVGAADILGNAMKLRAEDSSGRGRSYRDQVDFTIVPAVPIRVVKGVQSVDAPPVGPNGLNSNVDGSTVTEGSTVRFRIDLTNNGTPGGIDDYAAGGFDLWDVLPDTIRCANISAISLIPTNPATPVIRCTDPGDLNQPAFTTNTTNSAIRWTYAVDPLLDLDSQGIRPGQSWTFTYDMRIPPLTSAGFTFTNTASVRSYQALTNVPSTRPAAIATFFPLANVDTTVPLADQDAPAATDPSNVVTPRATVRKVGSTSITETNNDTATQATVGEFITYRYAVTVPARTTVFNGSLTDALPTGIVLQASPAPTLEFCPVAPTPTVPDPLPVCAAPGVLPPNISLNAATGAVTFTAPYDNATASAQRFLVTVTTRVTTAAITTAQNNVNRVNTATFTSTRTATGSALPAVTGSYTVNLRQPNPTIDKVNDRPSGLVAGGQVVTYTVSAFNRNSATSATNRPPLHDTFIVDCLPVGLTFSAYGANPGLAPVVGTGTNGCAVGATRLVWAVGDLAPTTAGITRTYTAVVNLSAVGGDVYTNTATLTGSTLNDGKPSFDAPNNPAERAYSVTDPSSITVAGAAVLKSVDNPTRTIGQTSDFTIQVVIPGNTNFFDAAVIDTVPLGLGAPTNLAASCLDVVTLLPCPGISITQLTPAPQANGSVKYGYFAGDLLATPNARRLTVTYRTTVLDVPTNIAGKALTNTALTAWFRTDGNNPTSAGAVFDRTGLSASATVTVIEPSLTIAKTVSDATPGPGDSFDYRLTATNSAGATRSSAFATVVTDVVPLGVVVDTVGEGGVLVGADPVRGGGTITWDAVTLPGPLAPGGSYTLTYSAHLAASSTLTAAALVNTARVTRYESLPTGGRVYAGPSTTASVTPQFPRLVTTKAATDGAPAYIGTPYTWTVTTTNTGGAQAFAVGVSDTLPPSWVYVSGSARVRVAGGPALAAEPLVITPGARDRLFWTNIAELLPGESVVVTYRATPTAGVVADPGVGSSVAHVNEAASTGEDATTASGNALGTYGSAVASAATRIDSADLVIDKTHAVAPVAGSSFAWTLAVRNAGPDTAVGPITVTDSIALPTTYVSASGTGWTCSRLAADLTCTRSNPADTLASGAAFPAISVVVAVPADVADGTILTNTASVAARTFDPATANNTDTDTAAVTTRADLSIVKSHSGPVVAGQDATYTLDVVNHGPSVSRGPITVVDTLPVGSTFVSATGPDWTCVPSVGSVTCTRSLDLAVGAAAPQVVVVVSIPSSQTAAVVNTATVNGTTTDPVPGNNTDSDSTSPAASADLSIQKQSIGPVVAGSPAVYRFIVDNTGPSDASAPVRITDTLPAGLTFSSAADVVGSWSCTAAGQLLTCDLLGDLAADPDGTVNGDAVVDVTVAVASSVVGDVVNTAVVSSPTDDPNPGNNSDTDTSTFLAEADLLVVKSHTGVATAGSQFHWTLAVRNAGPSDSPGDIVVTDGLPDGVTYVSATGTDWLCGESAGLVTCTRSTILAANTDAPDIDLLVAFDASIAPSTIVNHASVDGPITDPDPSNNTDVDEVVVVDDAELTLTKATTGADPVTAGATTEFTVTVTNLGPSTADSLVVSDTLPAGLVPVSASGTGWTCDPAAGQVVQCHRAAQRPGSSTIVLVARVEASVLDGTTLTNTATVSTSTPGDSPVDNTDTADVHVVARADLVLAKAHAPAFDTVAAGTEAEFTLDVSNAGPSDAQPVVVIDDALPAGLTFVSSAGPWTCTAGPVTPAGQDVSCDLTLGGPLAAGSSAPTLTLRVAVASDVAAGILTNEAVVSSPTTDPIAGNNSDTDAITVAEVADLSITKTHAGPVRVGDPLTFTLTVANAGPSIARQVAVTDSLPAGLTYVSASGTGWSCAELAGVVTCDAAAPLAVGATADPISVVVTVRASAYPSVTNPASVTSAATDVNPADNDAFDTVVVPALVDLAIIKSHTGSLQVGSDATYTIVVSNAGPTADPGPVTVTDSLPVGLLFRRGSGPGWTCSAAGQAVTCRSTVPLAVGATTTISLVVAVQPAAFPSVTNTVTVSTPSEETDVTNNTATDPAVVEPSVELALVKTLGGFDTGSRRATWSLVVTNNGPNVSQRPIVVSDVLPSGLTYVSSSGPGWSCGAAAQTVTCTRGGDLAVGASTGLELVTTVTGTPGQVIVNEASLVDNVDRVPENDRSDAAITIPGKGPVAPTGVTSAALLLLSLLALLVGGFLVVTTRRRDADSL